MLAACAAVAAPAEYAYLVNKIIFFQKIILGLQIYPIAGRNGLYNINRALMLVLMPYILQMNGASQGTIIRVNVAGFKIVFIMPFRKTKSVNLRG
jgi:hypothetical protein